MKNIILKRYVPKEVGLNIVTRSCNNREGFAVVDSANKIIAGPYSKMPFIADIDTKGEVRLAVVKADGTADLL